MKQKQDGLAASVDIGGTSIKIGIVTSDGRILIKDRLKTACVQNKPHFFELLVAKINALLESMNASQGLRGVGIGSPGISKNKGEIHRAANLHFLEDVNLVTELQNAMQVPVHLIKDSNAAALGEGLYGAAKEMKDYILITLGTGLGCSIFINNQLLEGNTGLAGEFGHAIVTEGGRECNCGKQGCLETYVSASGIVRTVMELLAQSKAQSIFRSQAYEEISPQSIFEAAQMGEALALQAFEYTGRILGLHLSNLLTLFDSEAIIIAGGLTKASKYLLPSINFHLNQNALPLHEGKAKVLLSALNTNEAALLGAASLVWKN